jgi:hypothetical protein
MAFHVGSIPVYHGAKEVFKIFNPLAFVFFDPQNPQLALDQIALLENDSEALREIMSQPILASGSSDHLFPQLSSRILDKMGLEIASVPAGVQDVTVEVTDDSAPPPSAALQSEVLGALQPPVIAADGSVQLVIIVPSARDHMTQRNHVRTMWAARNDPRVKTIFAIGQWACDIPVQFNELSHGNYTDFHDSEINRGRGVPRAAASLGCQWRDDAANLAPDEAVAAAKRAREGEITMEQKSLAQEAAQHGDMLFLPVIDVHRHLCQKNKLAFEWLYLNTNVEYVLKTDDDTIVSVGQTLRALAALPRLPYPAVIGNIKGSGIAEEYQFGNPPSVEEEYYRQYGAVLRVPGRHQERPYYQPNEYAPHPASHGMVLNRPMLGVIAQRHAQGKLRNYNCDECAIGIWVSEHNSDLGLAIAGTPVEVQVQEESQEGAENQDGEEAVQGQVRKGTVRVVNALDLGGDHTPTYHVQYADHGDRDPAVPESSVRVIGGSGGITGGTCSDSATSASSGCGLPARLLHDNRLAQSIPYEIHDQTGLFVAGRFSTLVPGPNCTLVAQAPYRSSAGSAVGPEFEREYDYKTELVLDWADSEHLLPFWNAYLSLPMDTAAHDTAEAAVLREMGQRPSWPSVQVQLCHRMWLHFSGIDSAVPSMQSLSACRHCHTTAPGAADAAGFSRFSPERATEAIERALAVDVGLGEGEDSGSEDDDGDGDGEGSKTPLTPRQQQLQNDGTGSRFAHMWRVSMNMPAGAMEEELQDRLFDRAEEIDPDREHF